MKISLSVPTSIVVKLESQAYTQSDKVIANSIKMSSVDRRDSKISFVYVIFTIIFL